MLTVSDAHFVLQRLFESVGKTIRITLKRHYGDDSIPHILQYRLIYDLGWGFFKAIGVPESILKYLFSDVEIKNSAAWIFRGELHAWDYEQVSDFIEEEVAPEDLVDYVFYVDFALFIEFYKEGNLEFLRIYFSSKLDVSILGGIEGNWIPGIPYFFVKEAEITLKSID